MLIAKNQHNTLVTASRTLDKTRPYTCPACTDAVYLKTGPVTRPHFAHFHKEACDVFSEGETEEHLQGKLQLREWLERQNVKVEMEAYLPELKQRPDLLVTLGKRRIAIEFQCSNIPIEKVVERTQGYQKAGVEVVWLLGEKFAYKQKLTAFQKACLAEMKGQLILFHYSVAKERLDYRYGFQVSQNQKITCRKKSLRKDCLLHIEIQKTFTKSQAIHYEMEHQKFMRQFAGSNLRDVQTLLYEKGETLISMPKEVYRRVPHEWLIHTQPLQWKMQLLWWLEEFPLKTVITKRMLAEWSQSLNYFAIPQRTETQKLQPIIEFLEILTETGILKQIRFDKWSIQDTAKRYKHLEEKLK